MTNWQSIDEDVDETATSLGSIISNSISDNSSRVQQSAGRSDDRKTRQRDDDLLAVDRQQHEA